MGVSRLDCSVDLLAVVVGALAGGDDGVMGMELLGWGVTLLVDSRYQEGTTRRDVIETQEVHPGVQG